MKLLKILIFILLGLSIAQSQTKQNNVLNLKKASIDTAAMRRAYIGGTLQNASAADSELTVERGARIKRGARVDGMLNGSAAVFRGIPAGTTVVITDTAINHNTSTLAQAGDTSAFNFSFTGTHKPMFSVVGSTGNTSMAVDSNGRLGIGIVPQLVLHTQVSGSSSGWTNDVYGTSTVIPIFIGRQACGTPSSPTQTLSSNTLSRLSGAGYTGTTFSGSKACVDIAANENWTDAANGTVIKFWTTKNGTTTLSEKVRIDDAGNIGVGTTAPKAQLDITKSIAIRDSTLSQITSNQNDYSTGTVSVLRLSTDASHTITGFSNGFQGRFIYITNVGSYNIVFANQNSLSSAANRIVTGSGGDLTINADQSVIFWYDNTSQRWRRIQ